MEDTNKKNGKETGQGPGNGKERKQVDILDEVKQVEAITKRYLLIQSLSIIKGMAHDIQELKVKSTQLLSEIGVFEADRKRIIDFINNLSNVRLSEEDVEDAKKWAKETISGKQKKIETEIQKVVVNGNVGIGSLSPITLFHSYDNDSHPASNGIAGSGTNDILRQFQSTSKSLQGSDIVLCDNADNNNSLKIKM